MAVSGAGEPWATAWAPGHATAFFAPAEEDEDPLRRGSVGAGIVFNLGAWAFVRRRPARSIRVRARDPQGRAMPISGLATRQIVGRKPGVYEVLVRHELPVAQGLSMSAAGALAAARAAVALLGRPAGSAAAASHRAEIALRGGLGGVAAILGGGLAVRVRPGVPPYGRVLRFPGPPTVWIVRAGPPIATGSALASPGLRHRLAELSPEVHTFLRAPDPESFWNLAERFTSHLRAGGPVVEKLAARLRSAGARAYTTLFGRCVVAEPPEKEAARRRALDRLRAQGLSPLELASARVRRPAPPEADFRRQPPLGEGNGFNGSPLRLGR